MEILSIDFEFPPYIVQGQECIDRVTSQECVAQESKPAKVRKCKKVQ